MKRYIHYGSSKFDPNRFKGFDQGKWNDFYSGINKPGHGVGLWGSPAAGSYISWREWCENEDFYTDKLKESFMFSVRPKAKILKVRCLKDIKPYMTSRSTMFPEEYIKQCCWIELSPIIDFKKLSKEYNGMELIHSRKTYCELHDSYFYTWDVDSIVVWDKEVIVA